MSLLRTSFVANETTQCPPTATRAQIISLLHDHEFMVLRNPLVLSHRRVSTPHVPSHCDAASPIAAEVDSWEIEDKMTFLPESIWPSSSVRYTMCFSDREDGMVMVLKAALGMVSRAVWTIEEGEGEAGLVLVEVSEVGVNRFVALAVKNNMHSNHEGLAKVFVGALEKLAKEGTRTNETGEDFGEP
ncbi:hypothetical protein MMC19_003837 [Ptychographa xylographoides]|nr:hypothetical protein [Ptychographa xylographoides]